MKVNRYGILEHIMARQKYISVVRGLKTEIAKRKLKQIVDSHERLSNELARIEQVLAERSRVSEIEEVVIGLKERVARLEAEVIGLPQRSPT